MEVLVTGATGFVGRALVPALAAAGHAVRALTRDASKYEPPDGVSVVEGDLLEPDTIGDALAGVDVAYYLVHSLQAGASFAERDREAASNFVRAANEAGVGRVVYLGGLGETGEELSEHLRSRREVEAVLAEGTFALTTLRAAIIVGADSASFTMIRQLAGRLPVMITPRWVQTECQPIAIRDVVAYLLGVLDVPETAGETYEIGGPDVLSYEQLLLRTARQLGKRPLIVPVPVLSPALSVYWVDLVTDVPKSVAHPLVYGLKNPVVVTDDRIRELVPVELTPFDEAVTLALGETAVNAARRPTHGGGDWAYVSLVSTLPGLSLDPRFALAVQFLVFEGVAIGLAAAYGLWAALPLATVAIAVSTLGSGLMVSLSARLRELEPPARYRRVLFESSVDVAMGVVAFAGLVTYLLLDAGGPGTGLLERLLGDRLPAPAVFFALLVAWDLCYRIGTGWWASITGLWRAIAFDEQRDDNRRAGYARADLTTITFAGLQLLLVPFLWPDQLLALLVLGHVGAVVVVSTLAILLERR